MEVCVESQTQRMIEDMDKRTYSIPEINAMSREEFVRVVGPVFEHSSWIAEEGSVRRPFTSLENLHRSLCEIVTLSPEEQQITLIQAHPDLVGRAALQGDLTPESAREQSSAGLGALTQAEVDRFGQLNGAYRQKFGFPFVICARLNKKDAILAGFEDRLKNSREIEVGASLEEIFKIARLRLQDLVDPEAGRVASQNFTRFSE